MFDFILLRNTATDDNVVDIGLLAETLLFYQKVHFILYTGTLIYLIRTLGFDTFISIMERPGVSCSFRRMSTGVHEFKRPGVSFYNFAYFMADGDPKNRSLDRSPIYYNGN
jgi:hypothetical protein